MKNKRLKTKLRSALTWILWALLVQFILINISAALYAHKLTHLYVAPPDVSEKHVSRNIFAKTWRLFTGPKVFKTALTKLPSFRYETVQLKTKDDIAIEAWLSVSDSTTKGTIVLFHGLMGNKGMVLDEANAFRELGYRVMMVDTRCHGNSSGTSTTIGYRESEEVKLAYDFLAQLSEKNIFLWGASMGAVEIIKAVSDYNLKPSGIIVEMPFLSLQTHLKGRARILEFPRQPFAFFTTFWIGVERGFNGFNFQTSHYARNVHCPVLEQYGEKDAMVLKHETDAIFEALASESKKLVMYEGGQHESFVRKDPALWNREVGEFLQRYSN